MGQKSSENSSDFFRRISEQTFNWLIDQISVL